MREFITGKSLFVVSLADHKPMGAVPSCCAEVPLSLAANQKLMGKSLTTMDDVREFPRPFCNFPHFFISHWKNISVSARLCIGFCVIKIEGIKAKRHPLPLLQASSFGKYSIHCAKSHGNFHNHFSKKPLK